MKYRGVIKSSLLWVACVPAGGLVGFGVSMVWPLLGGRFIAPDNWIHILTGAPLAGAAAVYVACRIAPSHKPVLALVLLGIHIFSLGLGLDMAIMAAAWGDIAVSLFQFVGMVIVATGIWKGTIAAGRPPKREPRDIGVILPVPAAKPEAYTYPTTTEG